MTTLTITQLFVFPVKSLRGIAVNSAQMTSHGLRYGEFARDRYWMVVKPNGGFITQRQLPQMVLIKTALTADALVLSKAGMEDLRIPFEYQQANNEPFSSKVWKDSCQVIDEGEAASQWLTQAIGTLEPVRLVRMADNFQRSLSKADRLGEHTTTFFADAAPYLVTNEQSLIKLNDALSINGFKPVPMERFRPNIVVDGIDAFAEHTISGLQHPDFQLKYCYPCQRCIMPTVDIDTGERHQQQQPFSLISDLNAMPDNPKAPAFGENAILSDGEGNTISVGDTLTVSQSS